MSHSPNCRLSTPCVVWSMVCVCCPVSSVPLLFPCSSAVSLLALVASFTHTSQHLHRPRLLSTTTSLSWLSGCSAFAVLAIQKDGKSGQREQCWEEDEKRHEFYSCCQVYGCSRSRRRSAFGFDDTFCSCHVIFFIVECVIGNAKLKVR